MNRPPLANLVQLHADLSLNQADACGAIDGLRIGILVMRNLPIEKKKGQPDEKQRKCQQCFDQAGIRHRLSGWETCGNKTSRNRLPPVLSAKPTQQAPENHE